MMTPLPIDSRLREIVGNLRKVRSLVVVAPPGSGKTTHIPPAIFRAGLLSGDHPNLVMLQPRRVAARAAAQRIADENEWTLGREVGYQIRFDKRITRDTRLRVLTEGILTRQILDDPSLQGVGCVILDEFHERSIHTDLAIALLREIQQSVRPDLMLLVMSATLAAQAVAQFLGDCPVIEATGSLFPVEIEYSQPTGQPLADRAADAVQRILPQEQNGKADMLLFLPGADEIRSTQEQLAAVAHQHQLDLIPLHGSLPFEQQLRALRPSDRRKLILSTNIAETSLTIEGVRTVIDSGFARVPFYDAQRGLDRLELKRISKASAAQRAGRAGRTAPGRCLRLWSAKEHHELDDFELPEICRVDLCATVLMLHAWGQPDPRKFAWFERPTDQSLDSAERLLAMLGALDSDSCGRITPIGQKLMSLTAHPRLGRLMLEAADAGCAEDGAALAAILSEKDFLPDDLPARIGDSDLIVRMELLPKLRSEAADQVRRVRDDLLQSIPTHARATAATDEQIRRWTLLAYPDRVARRRGADPNSAVMVGGGGVHMARGSVVKKAEFFVAVDARQDQRSAAREALVRIASAIEPPWLEQLFPHLIHHKHDLVFDEQKHRVVARRTLWYLDLMLEQDQNAPIDSESAAKVLAHALAPRAGEIFESDDSAASILQRLAFLRQWMPQAPWPVFDNAHLAELLNDACRGKRSLEEVRRSPLASILLAQLAFPLDRQLEEYAPQRIEVPSGNRIAIDYSNPLRPTLAVRLQELFGWKRTPRLAGQSAPVVLQLLGPNFRPVQITDDLHSFWTNTYPQVRKDLRVRYPKHSWPENPFDAKPQAKGRK